MQSIDFYLKPTKPEGMSLQRCLSRFPIFLLLSLLPFTTFGYGLMGPIAAAFGNNGFFCAIDASGQQEIICWDKSNRSTTSSSSSTPYLSSLPPMASLSGGEGFMCGITSNTSKAYCWNTFSSSTDLVPPAFQHNFYSQMAAGKNHVCAIRGDYFSRTDIGPVDCWQYSQTMNTNNSNVGIVDNSLFHEPSIDGFAFSKIVSGEGFSCGVVKGGSAICWGPKSANLGFFSVSGDFKTLASGRNSVCGISSVSGEVECWGKTDEFGAPPDGTRFVELSAGAQHYCGIRQDDLHGELSPLDWNLRLKIALQAAKGLEYLHKDVKPPIIHKDVKTSNILLDSEWGARISDFGLMSATDRDLDGDMESDVYNFGIVLLEILSGRKAYDRDCTPPGLVDWALPLIRQGKAAAIIDRNVDLPRNVEPLLKLADIVELVLRENPGIRPNMSDIVCLLDQNMKVVLTICN